MQLVLQTGVHYTEHDRLIRTLLRNAQSLVDRGVAVPPPGSYRPLIRDTLNAMHHNAPAPGAREVLLDAILGDHSADWVILSDPNFFRTESTAMKEGVLYPDAPRRMRHMSELFAEDMMEIYVGIRNPAALLPILQDVAADQSHVGFWGARRPADIRWSETITAIRAAAPRVPITVWCNEDMPIIWAQIIREMAGLPADQKIVGGFDLLSSIISEEGMDKFRAYLGAHPEIGEAEKRRVIEEHLEEHALDYEVEEVVDLPGWTDALLDQMTEVYDEDLHDIAQIPGVRLVTP